MEGQVSPKRPMSAVSIYAIRREADLNKVHQEGGVGEFSEGRAWVTGRELFLKAKAAGEEIAIVFASADVTDGLIYHGLLEKVELTPDGGTIYAFKGLTRIEAKLPLSTLRVRSTGNPLSDSFIRSYAICEAPSFLLRQIEEE